MTAASATAARQAEETVARLREVADPKVRDDMAPRYGIHTERALGVPMATMRAIARPLAPDHALAVALWATGWYEARTVAALVDEPARVTVRQMDAWARDFDNWAIVDTTCFHLFDRTAHAWGRVDRWCRADREFVRRSALALVWALALHDRDAPDDAFRRRLPLVEAAAHDERHLVHKAAAMALKAVAKRRVGLADDVLAVARRLADAETGHARRVGRGALREL